MKSIAWVTKLETQNHKLREALNKALEFIEAEGEYGNDEVDEARAKLMTELANVLEETK